MLILFLRYLFFFYFLLSLPSCASYKIPTSDFLTLKPSSGEIVEATPERKQALEHWAYKIIPKHRSQIRIYDLGHWLSWSLLGNDDDGLFAEENSSKFPEPKEIGLKRAALWGLRNPLHNFTFYVIGSAYWDNSELAIIQLAKEETAFLSYRKKGGVDFAGKSTSLFIGFHGWKPFVSLRLNYGRMLDTYAGWRWKGNFGLKLLPFKNVPQPERSRDE